MATWHSNYLDYLKYYYLETILGGPFKMYLQAFYDQIPAVYAPVSLNFCLEHNTPDDTSMRMCSHQTTLVFYVYRLLSC